MCARLYDNAGLFFDNLFGLKDDGDSTKVLQFQVSNITTATTRTATVGDRSGTLRVDDGTIGATATYTLKASDSGKAFMASKASATQTYTLPTTPSAGCAFTFVCTNAGGEILINPAAAEKISCKATVDAGATVAPAAGTGIKNTAATNVISDYITLVFDGTDTWWMTGQSGIWASQ